MQEPVNNNKSELWSLSLRDLFYKYIRFLPVFVLSVAFMLFIAYIYLRYATPIYNVGGTMLIKSEQEGAGRGDKFEDMFVNNKALNIQSEIEVLKSRPLMARVVDSLNLQFSYSGRGKIKTVNIYKQGPFLIDGLEIEDSSRAFELKIKFLNDHEFRVNEEKPVFTFGQVFKNSNGVFRLIRNPVSAISKDYTVNWQSTASAANEFVGALAVTPKTLGTGILAISMRTTNAQMGADIVNKMIELYGKYSIEQKNKTSDQILSFVDERLAAYGRSLDSAQQKLLAYEQQNNLFDVDAQSSSYLENIGEADKTIYEQTRQLNAAEMISGYLQDKKNAFNKVVVPSSMSLSDLTLNGLVGEYNHAQLERQQLLDANVPEQNPAIIQANGQIEKLRISIQENLKNIKNALNSVISGIQKQSSQNVAELKIMPAKIKVQVELKRQVEALQSLYKFLQEEREKTAISRASNISNSDMIDRAFPTTTPVSPNTRTIQILAMLLGLGLPAMVIFIGEVLNDKVATRFDIEKITPAPIIGEIGHSYSDKVLVVNKTTRSMVAEQFRIIRSNLQYILNNKSDKSTILVTSSFSGEGKSYISTNMGAVLALAGKKTIILEFDIRKPKVLSGLGMSKGPGITNFLVGKAKMEDLIRPVPEHENLFVLGCGPIPPNPSELLLDQRVEEMFIWLKENFDVILVDTAPVGMVSDAMTLSKFVNSTLYLVRQGHTFKKQVALIDEFYQDNKLPKVSIIINDVKMKPGYGYYGYGRYGYGYGYGYGSYYEEEVPPRNLLERTLAWLDIRRLFGRSKKNKAN